MGPRSGTLGFRDPFYGDIGMLSRIEGVYMDFMGYSNLGPTFGSDPENMRILHSGSEDPYKGFQKSWSVGSLLS